MAIGSIRTRTIARITALWGAVVLAVLTWQAATYQGLVALLAEWQFRSFGSYFPIATVFWLLVLLTVPLLVLLLARVRRRRRRLAAGEAIGGATPESARAVQRGLIGLTVAALIVAAVLLIAAMATRGDGAAQSVVLTTDASAVIEGPVRVKGVLRLNRLGVYRPAMVLPAQPLVFAPLTADDRAGPTLQYFAEIDQAAPAAAKAVELQGVAVPASLPGPVRQLYVDAGYRVADRTYVVYPTVEAARRRFTDLLPVPLVLALVFGIVALVQRRSMKTLAAAGSA
jgi:hypothetical protein